MKKYLLVGIVSLIVSFTYGQSDTAISYSGIVKINGTTLQLYQKAKTWLNNTFNDSKEVIQIDDKELGQISIRAIMPVNCTYHALGTRTYKNDIDFQLAIYIKEGKYKYVFSNYSCSEMQWGFTSSIDAPPHRTMGKKLANEVWTSTKEGIDSRTNALIESLKDFMNKKVDSDF